MNGRKIVCVEYLNPLMEQGVSNAELEGDTTNTGYALDRELLRVWCPTKTLIIPQRNLVSLGILTPDIPDVQRSDEGQSKD